MTASRAEPLQNRVLPTGEIVAHPARGLMMGNRGCIHGFDRTLGVTRWRSQLWICCVLRYKNVRRDVMPPGRWTALFFMDEATALAAGHRPCAYCRRADYVWFAESWQRAQGLAERPRAVFMDKVLHPERVVSHTRCQVTRPARAGSLPDGVMIRHDGSVGLLADGRIRPWSFDGYGAAQRIPSAAKVELLNPPSIVAAFEAGYRPMVHPSAGPTTLRVH
ncbi:MAG TPA: hypothetical protein VGR06_15935 [Actinophytocola sp.]|uniref:hypothetical protein n=1 Tax=Actinophytocola sp. TaxID=1872138 RepID=UPI002DFAE226|nr:hypothetical protein [Actinophytocola sp.]